MPPFPLAALDSGLPGSVSTGSFIGITVAIAGNVLISLALNLQKLAHRRLNPPQDDESGKGARNGIDVVPEEDEGREDAIDEGESTPLMSDDQSTPTPSPRIPQIKLPEFENEDRSKSRKTKLRSSLRALGVWPELTSPTRRPALSVLAHGTSNPPSDAVDTSQDADDLADGEEPPVESSYLKSKLWWAGLLLMSIGEAGNFISYAYAPASIVAPLGTVALIANCLFAPLLLGERLRKLEMFGVALAIMGALTVVASSKTNDVRLTPEGLVHAISQTPFIVYAAVNAVGAALLAYLAGRPIGEKYVVVDVGLCALFGGFTVLSTKGFSSMLSLRWFEIFTEWITYPVVLVLLLTAVGQIKHLNRALMKFDSKIVVPTQFVLFNLAAIVGSAVLYRDFDDVQFYRFLVFIYGCATTFAGVFCLTYRPSSLFRTASSDSPAADETTALIPMTRPPVLQARRSSASLGLSPGKYLLIATNTDDEPVTAIPIPHRTRTMSSAAAASRSGRDRLAWRPSSVR